MMQDHGQKSRHWMDQSKVHMKMKMPQRLNRNKKPLLLLPLLLLRLQVMTRLVVHHQARWMTSLMVSSSLMHPASS